jgi:crotonobetainyl-CoA:carnitine CoA-transferase CaiB-like acyl-CoA transferase
MTMEGALSGTVVLELGEMVAGQYCGMLLAGLGATVIRVDQPSAESGTGDVAGSAAAARYFLRSAKSSITLDVASAEGLAVLRQLVRSADIVVEALSWPVFALAADVLEDCPRVAVSLSWFGRSGPDAARPGSDLIAAAASGYMFMTGEPDRSPLMLGDQGQYLAGLSAALNALPALTLAEQTGSPVRLDVSVQESLAVMTASQPASFYNTGVPYVRSGNRAPRSSGGVNYTTITRCADGFVLISLVGTRGFEQFCAALGLDPQDFDADVRSRPGAYVQQLDAICADWAGTRTRAEIVAIGDAAGLHWSEVSDLLDLLANPQFAARGYLGQTGSENGAVTVPGAPFAASAMPWASDPPRPYGADNQVVYRRLGFTDKELDDLHSRNVV